MRAAPVPAPSLPPGKVPRSGILPRRSSSVRAGVSYLRLLLHTDGRARPIGHLSRYGDILRMSFDDDYVADSRRPLLSLAYRGESEADTAAILTSRRDARLVRTDGRWPAYFQNLLPEAHNRERLARERGCREDDEFELLAAAGHDLIGAVEVQPVAADEGVPESVRHWHTAMGLEAIEPTLVEEPVEDAAAIPGVVTKFSAVRRGRRYVVRRHGEAGSFILKLPTSDHPDLVQNEMMGYRLCDALGLDCAEASIVTRDQAELPEHVPFDRILAVRRFDRGPDGKRIHVEEFAQVFGYEPRHKYGRGLDVDFVRMLRVIDRLSADPVRGVREVVHRLVAFILMGNCDAHLKNWAVVYPDGRTPLLAPVYDPVCVASFFDDGQPSRYALNRAIDAGLCALTWDDLASLLGQAGLLRVPRLIRLARGTVANARERWPALLDEAPPRMREVIHARLDGGVALAGRK